MKLVLCPYGHKNEPDTRFCSTCNLPIPPDPTEVEEESEDEPAPVPVVLKEDEPPPPEPIVTPEVEPAPEPALPDGQYCPNGHWNPLEQERWCQECGELLFEEPEPEPEPQPFPWKWVAIGAGGLALIVAAVLIVGALTGDDTETIQTPITGSTEPPTTTTVPPAPVVLSPSVVTVSASSEQPSGDNFAVNVLDGRNDTAWGHCDAGCDPEEDAAADATGVGAFIQFDFEEPQRVVGFTIVNGYDKVVDDANDRWQQNTRVRTMTVTADGGQSQVVTLDDDRSVQEFELEFDQPTGSVRFTVDAVYSGDRWVDVTISEVRFLVLPDTSN